MIKSVIAGLKGKIAKVTDSGSLHVSNTPPDLAPIGEPNRYRYFSKYLHSDSDDTNVNMNVDGSITPVEFVLESHDCCDYYIMGISILIADASIIHNRFGNLTNVSVGWDLKLIEHGNTTQLIEKAKTGG